MVGVFSFKLRHRIIQSSEVLLKGLYFRKYFRMKVAKRIRRICLDVMGQAILGALERDRVKRSVCHDDWPAKRSMVGHQSDRKTS